MIDIDDPHCMCNNCQRRKTIFEEIVMENGGNNITSYNLNENNEQRNGNFTSGDFALAYRSSNHLDMEICSSLRLELIREGIEDYEKISILKDSLKDSDNPYKQAAYSLLLRKIAAFTPSSGTSEDIGQLLESAQELLDTISTGNSLESLH